MKRANSHSITQNSMHSYKSKHFLYADEPNKCNGHINLEQEKLRAVGKMQIPVLLLRMKEMECDVWIVRLRIRGTFF